MSGISTSTALLISAGVGLATTAGSLAYEATQSGPQAPSATTTATQEAEAASAASMAQAEALQKRRGLAATQLTSPMGTTGGANVAKATLG